MDVLDYSTVIDWIRRHNHPVRIPTLAMRLNGGKKGRAHTSYAKSV